MSKSPPEHSRTFLGIETGATHTTVLLVDDADTVLQRFDLGPANVRLLTNVEIAKVFREIKRRTGEPSAVAAGMAGLRNEADEKRVLDLAMHEWPGIPFHATNDLETALEAAGQWPDKAEARVLLLSGTGSCAYGRNTEGRTVKFGGRGHILGDRGSAIDIALQALRAIVYQQDLKAQFPALGQAILRALQLNNPDDLIPWTQEAPKGDIAQLAVTVFQEAEKGDTLARNVLREAADRLADMAANCATHLVNEGARVQFILAGGTLLKQAVFANSVSKRLHARWNDCRVEKLKRESIWGAITLAKSLLPAHQGASASLPTAGGAKGPADATPVPLESLAKSPTELRNPKTMQLDTMPLDEAIELLVEENEVAVHAVLQEKDKIHWLIEKTVAAFQSGGRLFYVGAGTSGRLGVLDASECPPTFRAPPEQVQGIIAGGQRALWSAVEGAEDNTEGGASAARHRGIKKGDVLVGIAASGRTPYVWGALREAKIAGATTALLAFNPHLDVSPEWAPDKLILIDVGPEPLTGSTRMKSGTATKVVLNTLTTLAMVHTGKVLSNLMVDMNPSNVKLRDRAVRLVRELTGKDEEVTRAALEEHDWVVKNAVQSLR
ncbi:N-acetylmuramic acid 6-phosphate etherase [Roseimicrobium gellanilyticum]|uniref:N-acetylmuramic acid 6-phosphate etherase n=1 Tax=Roseimicrobium gellanilyticum TaxID=748857 RepID=A0A366HQ90_9BACT|nr:N-acetylmuramic acid 6-phosphate etherase [Roseimicrobium gellanilyticum]RBP45019.1 N-acetylmuramic acid 6-phosphate etherase [Roseimicrobium gellanilyticum]